MGRVRTDWRVRLGLLAGSLALTAALAEAVSRAYHRITERHGHHRLFCQYDPLLGWAHKPNVDVTFRGAEYTVRLAFNAHGMRGDDHPHAKREMAFRVLVLGDSFAEGYAVELPCLFSEVLKRELARQGLEAEVLNAGVAGYSTDQELLWFQTEGKKYRPDLTILCFYYNDVWYNTRSSYWRGQKPLFVLEDGRLALKNVPVPQFIPEQPRDAHAWLVRHSYAYRYLRELMAGIAPLRAAAIRLRLVEPAAVPDEFGVWKKAYDPPTREAWKVTEALLEQLSHDVRESGSWLLVLYVPPAASIHPELWDAAKQRYGLSDAAWDVNQPERELSNLSRRHQIELLDPAEALKRDTSRGRRLYYPKDGHWTCDGNASVGQLLAGAVSDLASAASPSSRGVSGRR